MKNNQDEFEVIMSFRITAEDYNKAWFKAKWIAASQHTKKDDLCKVLSVTDAERRITGPINYKPTTKDNENRTTADQ